MKVQAKVLFRVIQSRDIALCCTWQTLISSNKRMGNILPGCLKLWLQLKLAFVLRVQLDNVLQFGMEKVPSKFVPI
jgi:hypothetical protein